MCSMWASVVFHSGPSLLLVITKIWIFNSGPIQFTLFIYFKTQNGYIPYDDGDISIIMKYKLDLGKFEIELTFFEAENIWDIEIFVVDQD